MGKYGAIEALESLLSTTISDPVDQPGIVVRNQKGPVGHYENVHRPAELGVAGRKPAVREYSFRRITIYKTYINYPVPDRDAPVPLAMFRYENSIFISRREHAPRIKPHSKRRNMGLHFKH